MNITYEIEYLYAGEENNNQWKHWSTLLSTLSEEQSVKGFLNDLRAKYPSAKFRVIKKEVLDW